MIDSLAQSVLFLTARGFGFGSIFQKSGGENYIQFIPQSIIAMSMSLTVMFTGCEAIYDRQFGFLKETLVALASRWTIIFRRTFGGATVTALQDTIVFLIALLISFRPENFSTVPIVIIYMILVAKLFTTFSTVISHMALTASTMFFLNTCISIYRLIW